MYFNNIIGQEEAKHHLLQTVKEGRISHAQLFLSPQGTGGLPLAIAYARYVLCSNKQEQDACGQCPSCVQLDKLAHPDLHFAYPVVLSSKVKVSDDVLPAWREAVLERPYMSANWWYEQLGEDKKQGVLGVAESAEIVRKLALKSFEGGYKVMIIWMAELMNTAAANKLLKIIEEPPEKTLFVLITENHEDILPTIISRTQLLKLNKIKEPTIATALQQAYGLEVTEANAFARLAEGSYFEAGKLVEEREEENQNFVQFRDWMRICFRRDVGEAIRWVDSMAGIGREKQKSFLRYGLHIFRQCIVGNYGDEQLVRLNGTELEFSKKFAPFLNGNNMVALVEEFDTAHYHIERNANPKILFLDLSFKVFKLLK